VDGTRSEWEYPFAVGGVNVSFMLTELLQLRKEPEVGHANCFPNWLGARALVCVTIFG
jgi:hypothetical protein